MRRPVAILLLLSFLTFFLGLGRQAITDSDEGFYAEAAREMVESGDWLTPHFNYEQRWQKPILYYWATAATYLATGPSEWGARCWAALSGAGLVLLTWAVGRRLVRRDDVALLAGAIVATSYGYFAMGRAALPDLPLTFCITLSIWSALERRWVLAGFAAGLGVLTKGPVALVIPALVLVPIWVRERRETRIRIRDLSVAAAVVAAISLPWYLAMANAHGAAYLQSFFIGDNLERFATDRFNGPRAIWYYVPIVVGGLVPWSAYLLVLPWRRGIDLLRRRQRLTAAEWRLAIWAAAPFIFYTLSVGKQPRYILPVLPPLAILLAHSIMHRVVVTGPRARPSERGLVIGTWLTAALYGLLAALLFRARPLFIAAHPILSWLGIAVLIGAAAIVGQVAASRAWARLPGTLAVTAVLLLLTMQFGAFAGVRPEAVEDMAALVKAHRSANEPVGEYQVFVRNLVFYTGFKQEDLFSEARALDFMKSPGRVLLVVRAEDLGRLESISGVTMRTLGQIAYLDTANIKLRTLFWPIPAQDLDTVLLVTNR